MHVGGIEIYETLTPGAVTRVLVRSNEGGQWLPVWSGPPQRGSLPASSRIFSPPLAAPVYAVRHVRLELDCRAPGSWFEIDAVRLLPGHAERERPWNLTERQLPAPSERVARAEAARLTRPRASKVAEARRHAVQIVGGGEIASFPTKFGVF